MNLDQDNACVVADFGVGPSGPAGKRQGLKLPNFRYPGE